MRSYDTVMSRWNSLRGEALPQRPTAHALARAITANVPCAHAHTRDVVRQWCLPNFADVQHGASTQEARAAIALGVPRPVRLARARRRATTARICHHARRVDADAACGTRKGNPSRGQTHPPEVGVTQTADTAQCAAHLHSCGMVHAAWTPDSDARVCVDWAERKVRTVSQQARYKCCDAPPRFATRTWLGSLVMLVCGKCRDVCAIADGESVILNRCCLELQSREKNYKNREKSTVWSRWTCTWKRPV
ncbi:hypothetical protein B0H10DRAFT_1970758 [Mycena sp. CBHHK59/15]|nr:hypothetical protein B0H10DRAFT_1970758 [Mycena sp. CBHHK59/15]